MSEPGRIRERMRVISSDDRMVGIVTRIGTDLAITYLKDGCGFDHRVPLDWIEEVGDSVFLNKSQRFLETHCADTHRDGALEAA
jgi:hypothetical protein